MHQTQRKNSYCIKKLKIADKYIQKRVQQGVSLK